MGAFGGEPFGTECLCGSFYPPSCRWIVPAVALNACLAGSAATPSVQADTLSASSDQLLLDSAHSANATETSGPHTEAAGADTAESGGASDPAFGFEGAACKVCTSSSECGNETCVVADGGSGLGHCRPPCTGSGGCAPGWTCVLHHADQANCLPLAGRLQGTANCVVGTGGFLGSCTGTLSGTFVGLHPTFGKGVLSATTWMGAQALALQIGVDMGLLGKPTLLFVLPKALQEKSYAIPGHVPTALFKMGSVDVMAPHFATGAAGDLKVGQLLASGAVPSQFQFAVDLALYSAPAAMCRPSGVGCAGSDVVVCNTCGTGFNVFTCPSGQTCHAGKCAGGK